MGKADSFESQLRRLNEIVSLMEAPGLPLSEAAELYSEGVRLAALCSREIEAVSASVTIIRTTADGDIVESNFTGL